MKKAADITVWLVTHGETEVEKDGKFQPDPGMTDLGFAQVTELRNFKQIKNAPEAHCGVGRRQNQVALALNFPQGTRIKFSPRWGDASTLVREDGQKKILLSHGKMISPEDYSGISEEEMKRSVADLPSGAVICSGRPVLVRLGMRPEECKSGAIYRLGVNLNGDDILVSVRHITGGVTL